MENDSSEWLAHFEDHDYRNYTEMSRFGREASRAIDYFLSYGDIDWLPTGLAFLATHYATQRGTSAFDYYATASWRGAWIATQQELEISWIANCDWTVIVNSPAVPSQEGVSVKLFRGELARHLVAAGTSASLAAILSEPRLDRVRLTHPDVWLTRLVQVVLAYPNWHTVTDLLRATGLPEPRHLRRELDLELPPIGSASALGQAILRLPPLQRNVRRKYGPQQAANRWEKFGIGPCLSQLVTYVGKTEDARARLESAIWLERLVDQLTPYFPSADERLSTLAKLHDIGLSQRRPSSANALTQATEGWPADARALGLREASSWGDSEALFELGKILGNSEPRAGIPVLNRAARRGHGGALLELATQLEASRPRADISQRLDDLDAATLPYRAAFLQQVREAQLGNRHAMAYVGGCFANGRGIKYGPGDGDVEGIQEGQAAAVYWWMRALDVPIPHDIAGLLRCISKWNATQTQELTYQMLSRILDAYERGRGVIRTPSIVAEIDRTLTSWNAQIARALHVESLLRQAELSENDVSLLDAALPSAEERASIPANALATLARGRLIGASAKTWPLLPPTCKFDEEYKLWGLDSPEDASVASAFHTILSADIESTARVAIDELYEIVNKSPLAFRAATLISLLESQRLDPTPVLLPSEQVILCSAVRETSLLLVLNAVSNLDATRVGGWIRYRQQWDLCLGSKPHLGLQRVLAVIDAGRLAEIHKATRPQAGVRIGRASSTPFSHRMMVARSTLATGPRFNRLSKAKVPIRGLRQFDMPSSQMVDKFPFSSIAEISISPDRIEISGQREPNPYGGLISRSDVLDLLTLMIFDQESNVIGGFSLEPLVNGSGLPYALQAKVWTPDWLEFTAFGRTQYIADAMFFAGNDGYIFARGNPLRTSAERFVPIFARARASGGAAVGQSQRVAFELKGWVGKAPRVSVGDSAITISIPEVVGGAEGGDLYLDEYQQEFNLKSSDMRLHSQRYAHLLTKSFEQVERDFPIFERLRKLMGILEALNHAGDDLRALGNGRVRSELALRREKYQQRLARDRGTNVVFRL